MTLHGENYESAKPRLQKAQSAWAKTDLRTRARACKKLSGLIADHAHKLHLALMSKHRRDYAETVSAELLPFAGAAVWLAKSGSRYLKPKHLRRSGLPYWLGKIDATIYRAPHGILFIIGTWNYPIFLVGSQMVQALFAGNAVVIKPAFQCERITTLLVDLCIQAGFPSDLFLVLDSEIESARKTIQAGVDKVILTGSVSTGKKVLSQLAEKITPSVMELSGCDSMFVLESANVERAVSAIVFGLRINSGATCMAPRRIIVDRKISSAVQTELRKQIRHIPSSFIDRRTWMTLRKHFKSIPELTVDSEYDWFEDIEDADDSKNGATFTPVYVSPTIISNVDPTSEIAKLDFFAPVAMLIEVDNVEQAFEADSHCPYALSSSIFGDPVEAIKLADRLPGGNISINDVIVPTADPRIPFGGTGQSGYGSTRGKEGLMEMTRPKTVSVRYGNWLPHLETPQSRDAQILEGVLQCAYSSTLRKRYEGLKRLLRGIRTPADSIGPKTNQDRNND